MGTESHHPDIMTLAKIKCWTFNQLSYPVCWIILEYLLVRVSCLFARKCLSLIMFLKVVLINIQFWQFYLLFLWKYYFSFYGCLFFCWESVRQNNCWDHFEFNPFLIIIYSTFFLSSLFSSFTLMCLIVGSFHFPSWESLGFLYSEDWCLLIILKNCLSLFPLFIEIWLDVY